MATIEQIHRLWDELADFSAEDTDAGLSHLLKTVCRWLGADNAVWVGGVRVTSGKEARRDPQHGWRGRAMRQVSTTQAIEARFQLAMRQQDAAPAMTTTAVAAGAGTFRVHRLRDGFVDFNAFRRTSHYRTIHQALGITDRMWASFPVNADTESCIVFDHMQKGRRFSKADAALVERTLRGIKWFHRQLFLSYGLLLAQTPLSPAQRRTLLLLLSSRSEKEIASQLQLTPGTVHQYAVELYRKLGVNSRAGLMALWLGQGRQKS